MQKEREYIGIIKASFLMLFIMLAFSSCLFFFKDEEKEVNLQKIEKVNKGPLKEDYFLILNESTGEIEKVDEYSYALGSVMAEMPPSFHIEALKAQSLASLTRARYLKKEFQEGRGSFENCHFSQNPDENEGYMKIENAGKQYKGKEKLFMDKMKKAADYAVRRELVYDDENILASYHAMSAGFTEDCENVWDRKLPYLVKRESYGDSLSPDFIKETKVPFQAVKNILCRNFPKGTFKEGEEENWIRIEETSKGGYVQKCDAGGVDTDGKTIRKIFNLRSASFTLKLEDDNFIFTTKGYGHGVGLSQVGADFMARQGKSADEILKHYYKGAEVNLI